MIQQGNWGFKKKVESVGWTTECFMNSPRLEGSLNDSQPQRRRGHSRIH